MNFADKLKQRKIDAIKTGAKIKNVQWINIFPPMGEYKCFNVEPDTELTVKCFNGVDLITVTIDTPWECQPKTSVSLSLSDVYLA